MSDEQPIADALREFLDQPGMTLGRFAALFDPSGKTTAASVWRWKTARVTPGRYTQDRLREVMNRYRRKLEKAS